MGGKGSGRIANEDELKDRPPEEQELEEIINAIGGTAAKCKISRVSVQGDPRWVQTIAASQVTEELIRREYGPGQYICEFRADTGRYIRKKSVFIDELKPQLSQQNTTTAAPGTGGLDIQFVLESMRASEARSQQLMLEMIKRPSGNGTPAPVLSPVDMMTGIINAIASLKGMVDPESGKTQIKEILEIAEMIGGRSTEENVYTVVKEVGTKVLEIVSERIVNAPPAVVAETPALSAAGVNSPSTKPGAHPDPNAAAPEAVTAIDQMKAEDWIKAQLAFLKQKATTGKDVGLFVDYILANQDETGCAALTSAIRQGVTWEQLLQFDPEIGQNAIYQIWFLELYNALREDLMEVDPDRPEGDGSDPPSDEGSSPPGQPESTD